MCKSIVRRLFSAILAFVSLRLPFVFLLASLLCARAFDSSAPIIREPGAIYLSDFASKPIKTSLSQPANACFHIDMKTYAGTLRPNQTLEIVAISENGDLYRVRGMAQQGQILGWVRAQDVQALDPEFAKNLKKAEERRRIVNALIAKNEVAIGMTPQEVHKSLGKPNKKTNKANQTSTEQTWEYVKYANVPQQVTSYDAWGNLVASTIYVKKPVGKLTAVFSNDLVSSLEQSEGTISSGNEVQIVVPPVVVY